jgi:hypothetical protein
MATPPQRTSREVLSSRVSRRPPGLAVTLVALAIVFALAWMFFLRSGPAATAPVVHGVQGTSVWQEDVQGGAYAENGAFSASAAGNAGGRMEITHLPPGSGDRNAPEIRSAYDAGTRTETSTPARVDEPVSRTVGEWPPVWRVATRSPLDYQGLAAVVRTAVEDGDETVGIKPLKDGDRAVWRATLTLSGRLIDVVVDQQSGIVTWYSDGVGTFTAAVDWGAPPPADETYAVTVPDGEEVETSGSPAAYEETPAAAGRAAGYAPLVSGLAPDGYELQAVATVPAGFRPLQWIADDLGDMPPVAPGGTAVLELYTRGLSCFTVEQVGPATLRSLDAGSGWDDRAQSDKLSYEETTLQYGAFAGATAATWYQESGPSLFVAGARRAVFITGALTRQELVAFAEGLKPVPGDGSR